VIPLSIECDVTSKAATPFVSRLAYGHFSDLQGAQIANLVGEDEDNVCFQSGDAIFYLSKANAEMAAGDVLYLDPRQSVAHRWIRSGSAHNSLLITEQCDQLCLMCSQPPKKTHQDFFEHFYSACLLAPCNMTIGFSGGEPTLHKHSLIDLLSRLLLVRPDLRFHVLTNAQHFELGDREALRRLTNTVWGIPLYSADAQLHDSIVFKEGAFDRLCKSLATLCYSGAAIELRTVIMRSNARDLPNLSSFITSNLSFIDVWAIMQLENIGFAKNRWTELFFDHSADFSPIDQALGGARLHGVEVALYNFPLCTVPQQWRSLAAASISDWKKKFLDECRGCAERNMCSGFFEWHPKDHGYIHLEAL